MGDQFQDLYESECDKLSSLNQSKLSCVPVMRNDDNDDLEEDFCELPVFDSATACSSTDTFFMTIDVFQEEQQQQQQQIIQSNSNQSSQEIIQNETILNDTNACDKNPSATTDKGANNLINSATNEIINELQEFHILIEKYLQLKDGDCDRQISTSSSCSSPSSSSSKSNLKSNRIWKAVKPLLRMKDSTKLERVLLILGSCFRHLKKGTLLDARGIYYENVTQFNHNQKFLNTTLSWLLKKTGLKRENLNIRLPQKGKIFGQCIRGSLSVCDGERMSQPEQIPTADELDDLNLMHVDKIIIIEKETIFTQFVQGFKHFEDSQRTLIVTGMGYPCQALCSFLRQCFKVNPSISFLSYVDGDPYGIQIHLTYKYGALKNADIENIVPNLPNLRWAGISAIATDLELCNSSFINRTFIEISSVRERNLIKGLIGRISRLNNEQQKDDLINELLWMMEKGRKYELEAVFAEDPKLIREILDNRNKCQ